MMALSTNQRSWSNSQWVYEFYENNGLSFDERVSFWILFEQNEFWFRQEPARLILFAENIHEVEHKARVREMKKKLLKSPNGKKKSDIGHWPVMSRSQNA